VGAIPHALHGWRSKAPSCYHSAQREIQSTEGGEEVSEPKSLAQRKADGDCYFCSTPAKDSTETVNGKPDDHKVCSSCLAIHKGAIARSRAMIAAYERGGF
jgi:hypothetical protein